MIELYRRLKLAWAILRGRIALKEDGKPELRVPSDHLLVKRDLYDKMVKTLDNYKLALGVVYSNKATADQWERLLKVVTEK